MSSSLRQGRRWGGTAGAERGHGVGTEGLGWEGRPTVTDRKERRWERETGEAQGRAAQGQDRHQEQSRWGAGRGQEKGGGGETLAAQGEAERAQPRLRGGPNQPAAQSGPLPASAGLTGATEE